MIMDTFIASNITQLQDRCKKTSTTLLNNRQIDELILSCLLIYNIFVDIVIVVAACCSMCLCLISEGTGSPELHEGTPFCLPNQAQGWKQIIDVSSPWFSASICQWGFQLIARMVSSTCVTPCVTIGSFNLHVVRLVLWMGHIHTPANAILAESRQSGFTFDCIVLAIDFGQVTQACGPPKKARPGTPIESFELLTISWHFLFLNSFSDLFTHGLQHAASFCSMVRRQVGCCSDVTNTILEEWIKHQMG